LAQDQAAVELQPDDAVYQRDLAVVLFDLKRYDEAVDRMSQVVAANPTDTDKAQTRDDFGDRFRQAGRYEDALAQYQAAVELQPDDAVYQRDLAVVLFDLKRYDEAAARAGDLAAPELQASYRDALRDVFRQGGRYEGALAQDQAAVELQADNAVYQRDLAAGLCGLTL